MHSSAPRRLEENPCSPGMADNNIPLPRNFKLLEELDASEGKKGLCHIKEEHLGYITYGADYNDPLLHNWFGEIAGPQNKPTGDIEYKFSLVCTDKYPAVPPEITFVTKIAMPAVDNRGRVDYSKLKPAFHWHPSMNIPDALAAIRVNMHDATVIKDSNNVRGQKY